MKLKPLAFGVAIGIVWGGCIFLTTILSLYTGYGKLFLEAVVQSVYPGYKRFFLGLYPGKKILKEKSLY